MIPILLAVIFIGLFLYWSAKNFLVQIVAMKLVLDSVFFLLILLNQKKHILTNIAWIFMSFGMSLIFLTMVVSIRRLSMRQDLDFSGDQE